MNAPFIWNILAPLLLYIAPPTLEAVLPSFSPVPPKVASIFDILPRLKIAPPRPEEFPLNVPEIAVFVKSGVSASRNVPTRELAHKTPPIFPAELFMKVPVKESIEPPVEYITPPALFSDTELPSPAPVPPNVPLIEPICPPKLKITPPSPEEELPLNVPLIDVRVPPESMPTKPPLVVPVVLLLVAIILFKANVPFSPMLKVEP